MPGPYETSFNGIWYCCACKAKGSLLPNPNSPYSTSCEDSSCGHTRCGSCSFKGGGGGGGGGWGGTSYLHSSTDHGGATPRNPAKVHHSKSSSSPNTVDVSHLSGQVQDGTTIPRSPAPPIHLSRDGLENADRDNSVRLETVSSKSSRSSIISEHLAPLSSSRHTRGATEAQTIATTVSSAAKNAGINHSNTDQDENMSVASSIDQIYSGFATVLGNNLVQDLQEVDLARFENKLVSRLEEFSLRFGNENESANHLRMMSIVYRHSRRIASQICRGTYDEVGGGSISISDGSSLEDSSAAKARSHMDDTRRDTAIAKWLGDLEVSTDDTTYDETVNTDVQNAEAEGNEEEITSGHGTLLESEAYRWLVSVLQRSSRLNGIEPHCMSSCREMMTQRLHTLTGQESQVSRSHRLITSKRQPPIYRARFGLSWGLLKFLQKECEGKSPGEVVDQVVTLTGDGRSVQAETCRGYLEQVWPTTGSDFMNLVVDLVTRTGQSCKRIFADRTEISARLQDKTCVIEALSTQSSLIDLAEQLLWISSALRSPSRAADITLCSAELVPTVLDLDNPLVEETYHQRCLGTVDFHIAYTTSLLPDQPGPAEGDCWMQVFSPCRVVSGYPIPTRNTRRPGLELPLEIMASMIGADRVTPFGHDLIMKGYSDLFYATEQSEGCIIWHLICNKGESRSSIPRISFADKRIPRPTDPKLSLLQPSDALLMRHIVGWTATVRSNAGAPDVEYGLIASSYLDEPSRGWALEKVQISGGKYVNVGATLALTKRKKPIPTEKQDYISRLLCIGQSSFLLCDVDTRKVWLVNGLSTLLHLVRTHLVNAESHELHQTVLLSKASDLKAEGGRSGSRAALETLRLDSNRRLRLHRKTVWSQTGKPELETEAYYCLEELVNYFLHILEQIIDHQSDVRFEEASVGCRIRRSPWNCLEGFDFMDIATKKPKIAPRGMKLRADGRGWAQLTRALDAPTLFGTQFGEMLEPVKFDPNGNGCSVCLWNDKMPEDRDLLAVQVEDLLSVGREEGTRLRLNMGLCLDIAPALFEPCSSRCQSNCRIGKMQRASENAQPPLATTLVNNPTGLISKAFQALRVRLTGRQPQGRTDGDASSSTAGIPRTGAIILGSPRKPRNSYWSLPWYNDDQNVTTSSSQSDNTTDVNLDLLSSPAPTESTPPTHLSSPHPPSTSARTPCSPGSSASPSV